MDQNQQLVAGIAGMSLGQVGEIKQTSPIQPGNSALPNSNIMGPITSLASALHGDASQLQKPGPCGQEQMVNYQPSASETQKLSLTIMKNLQRLYAASVAA